MSQKGMGIQTHIYLVWKCARTLIYTLLTEHTSTNRHLQNTFRTLNLNHFYTALFEIGHCCAFRIVEE